VENLALTLFLHIMMRALSEEIFESLKVSPKWLARFLSELHDILSNEDSFVDWVEFLQEGLDEIIPRRD